MTQTSKNIRFGNFGLRVSWYILYFGYLESFDKVRQNFMKFSKTFEKISVHSGRKKKFFNKIFCIIICEIFE